MVKKLNHYLNFSGLIVINLLNKNIKNFNIGFIKTPKKIKTIIEAIESSKTLEKSLTKSIATSIKKLIKITTASFNLLSGLHISTKTVKPVTPNNVAQTYGSSEALIENKLKIIWTKIITTKLQIPPGVAFLKTFLIKLPLTTVVVGSNVRKKEGKPIVNMLIIVNWYGTIGNLNFKNKAKKAKEKEKMFLTKKAPQTFECYL